MDIHFNEKREPEIVTWNQLDIGDIYYHRHTHDIGVKTGANTFYYFTDKSYHHWPRYLIEAHKEEYKNFIRCSYALEVNYDVR